MKQMYKFDGMRYLLFLMISMVLGYFSYAQDLSKMNKSNTWVKAGPHIGVPISSISSSNNFIVGLDLSIQFIETEAYGIGFKTGYSHYLGSGNNEAFGEIPLALLSRFYPKTSGLFAGIELGYSILNNFNGAKGGYCSRPHIGFHTDNWNFYGYYEVILMEDDNINDIQSVGLSATYNLRFK